MVCKKIFLIKAKKNKNFCTGCPKSALREGKTKFLEFFFIGASAIKSWEKSRIFRYGLPGDFFSKGQKTTGGGAYCIVFIVLFCYRKIAKILQERDNRGWKTYICVFFVKHISQSIHNGLDMRTGFEVVLNRNYKKKYFK